MAKNPSLSSSAPALSERSRSASPAAVRPSSPSHGSSMESPPAAKRRKTGRGSGVSAGEVRHFPASPLSPATEEDKTKWSGFAERESDPAFFNAYLRGLGVQGARMQEVVGVDDDLLSMLPRPVFGLLFLHRYHSRDSRQQAAVCPAGVWFANQIQENACSTISLLNLVNNAPDLALGEDLERIKNFTRDFSPFMRGTAVNDSDFIRQHHNHLARKMQMLVDDTNHQASFEDFKRAGKNKAARGRKRRHSDEDSPDEDAAYHYLAFVPVDGEIYLLDGVERQPQRVATYSEGEDWLSAVRPTLEHEMALSEGLDFNIMALVHDRLPGNQQQLAANIKAVQSVQDLLDAAGAAGDGDDTDTVVGPSERYGITEAMLAEAQPTSHHKAALSESSDQLALLGLRAQLRAEQGQLRAEVRSDLVVAEDEGQKTTERAHDYSGLIHTWLGFLAKKEGVMKDLIEKG